MRYLLQFLGQSSCMVHTNLHRNQRRLVCLCFHLFVSGIPPKIKKHVHLQWDQNTTVRYLLVTAVKLSFSVKSTSVTSYLPGTLIKIYVFVFILKTPEMVSWVPGVLVCTSFWYP